ncbi:glycosyltransferase [Actinokineospora terrae]|uniref:Glycosyltransferase family 28 C-terminal domain-containing protein n=1 Tax=Actinokineospora terrae TaxID=155974 RepID=A0A1H9XGU4_9PSEU|nr:glycosyltransferase [Actinokineospora terrae]SES45251.1 Glycosyltransferase family 28 C-terminal domain-containing protein [Actinokineospora terrae]
MIAYYVHHHGSGHLHRARAIAAALRYPVIGLSSAPRPVDWPGRWVQLADDADGVADDVTAHGTLHWVPRHHRGLRERMAAVSGVLGSGDVRVLVSDVSVEIALLARLHGVPTVVMAQPGDRTDRPHRLAYDLATRLLAPWPRRPQPDWPSEWLAKTIHLGGLSRFDGRRPSPGVTGRVLALWGSGGLDVVPAGLDAAAAATPDWAWTVAGAQPVDERPNLRWAGWVDDPWEALCGAEVVVTHGGQNAVAEVAAARRAAVVIPQERPFGEQRATGAALLRDHVAVVVPCWPAGDRWPDLLQRARDRGGAGWARWSAGDGAVRAAAELDALAA